MAASTASGRTLLLLLLPAERVHLGERRQWGRHAGAMGLAGLDTIACHDVRLVRKQRRVMGRGPGNSNSREDLTLSRIT